MRQINNFTSVDALGAQYNLYRESKESVEDFQDRLRSCVINELKRDKYSFERSLDYITSDRTKDVLRVKVPDGVSISFDGVKLTVGDKSFFIETYKFLKDFKQALDLENVDVTELLDYSDYLKCSNIIQFTSDRVRLEYETPRTNLFDLNENQIQGVVDYEGLYSDETNGSFTPSYDAWDKKNSLEEFIINSDSDSTSLLRENKEGDSITYAYKEKYLIIKWSVFSFFNLNDENFDYRIKEKVRVSSSDEEDTPHILSQDGAKLLNKCYKISNTYWGE